VTTLVNTKGPSKKKKGRSKRAHVLVAAVEKATENFIEKGELIAYENPDIKQEMLSAVEEVRKTGIEKSLCSLWYASPFELPESPSLFPWRRVLPEKLTDPQLLKKFPTFYGT
jgi:hypothetical protein